MRKHITTFSEYMLKESFDETTEEYLFHYYDLTGRSPKNIPYVITLEDALDSMEIDINEPVELQEFMDECYEGAEFEGRGFKMVCIKAPY